MSENKELEELKNKSEALLSIKPAPLGPVDFTIPPPAKPKDKDINMCMVGDYPTRLSDLKIEDMYNLETELPEGTQFKDLPPEILEHTQKAIRRFQEEATEEDIAPTLHSIAKHLQRIEDVLTPISKFMKKLMS